MKTKNFTWYYWVIVALVLVEMGVYGGVVNNLNSLFTIPVTEDLGISRSSFSLAMSLRPLMAFVFSTFASLLFLRFGYRKLITLGMLGGCAALVILAHSHSMALLCVGGLLLGVFESLYSTIGATKIIGDWFHKNRGLVLGLVTAASGLGGSLFCVVQTNLIQNIDWRAAQLFAALMMAGCAVLLAVTIRNRPDDLGLRPYGEGTLSKKSRHRAGVLQDNWAGFSLKELVRKPTFYMMMAATFLSSLSLYLAFYVMVPHLRACGLSVTEAATLQSAMLLLLAVAKLGTGVLSDWIGGKNVTTLCMVCTIVGLWLLAGVENMAGGIVSVVIYTIGLPLTTITVPMLVTSLFGYRAHDTSVGMFLSMVSVGGLVASPLCNMAYDAMGTYRPVIRAAAVLALATTVLFLVLYRMADQDKKKWLQENEN